MSVSAELWRIATDTRETAPPAQGPITNDPGLDDPFAALARQVFFPAAAPRPRHVLFVAADDETRAIDLCQTIAIALARLSRAQVAVVGGAVIHGSAKKLPQSIAEASLWRAHSDRVNADVWRLPARLFCDRLARELSEQRRPPAEFQNAFEYFVFAANTESGELPIFSAMSDAAVLLVTANRTRRDSALHAKEKLARYKLPLLGTVLNDRVLEIPQAIYRRL
jgi:hypothetical protein